MDDELKDELQIQYNINKQVFIELLSMDKSIEYLLAMEKRMENDKKDRRGERQ